MTSPQRTAGAQGEDHTAVTNDWKMTSRRSSAVLLAEPASGVSQVRSRYGVVVLGATLFLITYAVSLPAPLYSAYARISGYGTGATTLAFACYVAGIIPVLIGLGGISDRIGRKTPLMIALLLGFAAILIISLRPSINSLAVARFFLGIGTALMGGAGPAFLTDLVGGSDAPRRAAAIVTVSTAIGFGGGALLTGLCQLSGETLVPPSYLVYIPVVLACFVALAWVPDITEKRPVAWVRLPYFPAGTFLFGCAILTAWAAMGVITVLVSVQLAKSGLVVWSGASIFLLSCVGLLVLSTARHITAALAVRVGLAVTALGYILTVIGTALGSVGIVMLGAALSSTSCLGFTYVGGLAAVSEKAGDQHRARATSGFFLFAYFGFSLPVVITGFLADAIGLMNALWWFGAFVVVSNVILFVRLGLHRTVSALTAVSEPSRTTW